MPWTWRLGCELVLFATYPVDVPWVIPETLLGNAFIVSYAEALPERLSRARWPEQVARGKEAARRLA